MKKILWASAFGLVLTSAAWAGDINLNVTGQPSTIQQGKSATFTINISYSGDINLDLIPATLTIQSAYIANDGSSTPVNVYFTAPDTPDAGCVVYENNGNGNNQNAGQCKPAQKMALQAGSTSAVTATVTVPASLAPGTYTITVAATHGNGLDVGSMPSFEIEVIPVGSKPTVTITHPNGDAYTYGQTVMAAVNVDSFELPTAVSACLNGADDCANIVLSTDDTVTPYIYNGTFHADQLCANTFSATASNSAGTGDASSSFTVTFGKVTFQGPVITSKFQGGRTLPVMFTILQDDGNGNLVPTTAASPDVTMTYNNHPYALGKALLMYDNGLPFYQINATLPKSAGIPVTFTVAPQACGPTTPINITTK
jgi:hypothetical protein